jgi:hypothetical protein
MKFRYPLKSLLVGLLPITAFVPPLPAAVISYGTTGSVYSQDFDFLTSDSDGVGTSAWTNGTTLNGWYGTIDPARSTTIAVSTGGSSTISGGVGTLTSMGPSASNERALGMQPGGGFTQYMGARIENATGGTLSQFTLGYTGEQWRRIDEATLTLVVEYQVFASGAGSLDAASGWTTVSALDFTGPATGASGGRNGNTATNRTVINGVDVPVTWDAGQDIWIRWTATSTSATANRQMLGVDDLTFTAVPEPSALLLGMAYLPLLSLRRRR